MRAVAVPCDSRRRLILLIRAARDDPRRLIRQRPLPRFGFIPRRSHPDVLLFLRRQDHWHAFGWIGSTIAFGGVVRKP